MRVTATTATTATTTATTAMPAMTKTQAVEAAILDVLRQIGPATARVIEARPEVVQACRLAKIKARDRLALLAGTGRVKTCGSRQAPVFWC